MSSKSGDRERQPHPEPVQRRVAAPAQQPHRRHRAARIVQLVLVLVGLDGEVVPEPLGLLVRVGVTADVHEQRRVVDDDLVLVGQPELICEPEGDQALAEHVLHRLPEPEVDPEGQRGHELRQPDLARRVTGGVRA
jgi:hypothetical protein